MVLLPQTTYDIRLSAYKYKTQPPNGPLLSTLVPLRLILHTIVRAFLKCKCDMSPLCLKPFKSFLLLLHEDNLLNLVHKALPVWPSQKKKNQFFESPIWVTSSRKPNQHKMCAVTL